MIHNRGSTGRRRQSARHCGRSMRSFCSRSALKTRMLGMISLGPKRSEAPYSKADLQLLSAVASQTGLALENAELTETIRQEVAERERANRELEIAREVQERLFPQILAAGGRARFRRILQTRAGCGRRLLRFHPAPRRRVRYSGWGCLGERDRGRVDDGQFAGFTARPNHPTLLQIVGDDSAYQPAGL